jgi:hypothetical protein
MKQMNADSKLSNNDCLIINECLRYSQSNKVELENKYKNLIVTLSSQKDILKFLKSSTS